MTTVVGELGSGGSGVGVISAGAASNPFFVVDEFEFGPKRRLAFGAEATRRMNLDAAEEADEDCLVVGELVVDWEKCDPDCCDVIDCLNVRAAGDWEVGDAVSWSAAMTCTSLLAVAEEDPEFLKLLLESLLKSRCFSDLRTVGVGVETAVVVEERGE